MKQQFAAKHPWTILAAGAAIQVLTGLPAAWGVFQQPVMEEYGLSEQGAGYAFALLIAAFGVGCVLGGFLQDKKGPRCAALWGTALLCGGFFAAAFLLALRPEKLNLCEEDESEDKAAAHPEPAFYGTVVDVVFYGTIDKVFVRLDNSNQTVVAYQYFDDVKRWTPDERVGIWWYERDEVKVQR